MSVEQEIMKEFQASADGSDAALHAICRKHYKRLCAEYEDKFGEPVPERWHKSNALPTTMCKVIEEHIINGFPMVRDEDLPKPPGEYHQVCGGNPYSSDWLNE